MSGIAQNRYTNKLYNSLSVFRAAQSHLCAPLQPRARIIALVCKRSEQNKRLAETKDEPSDGWPATMSY